MNLEDFQQSARTQGFAEPLEIQKPKGYAMGGHDHPFDAFALITQGQIDIGVGGIVTPYRVGDVFQVPRGTQHTESAVEHGVVYLAARRHPV